MILQMICLNQRLLVTVNVLDLKILGKEMLTLFKK